MVCSGCVGCVPIHNHLGLVPVSTGATEVDSRAPELDGRVNKQAKQKCQR